MSLHRARLAHLLVAALLAAPLAACSAAPDAAHTLNVLAGSELRDIEPLLPDMEKKTGVHLNLTYIGTLEGAERIVNGDPADAAWFSHGKYIQLLPGAGSKIVASEKIALSPVVLGVKQSVADRFGWGSGSTVTWKDIQAKAADGSFQFAMTNPAASNSGFTALIGVAAALAGSSDSLDTGKIDTDGLKAFFKGQTLTAGSSGFLADAYVRSESSLDGLVNYESILLSLNRGGKLHEPLTLVYPSEGIVTADYPFMLLNGAKRDAWQAVVDYLRTPDVQKRIMTDTLRRPAVPGVPLDAAFPSVTLVELPFPSKLDTINKLLTAYLDEIRTPAAAIFVLDVSGSMQGDRIDRLRKALAALTGTDQSLTGQFSRLHAREQVTIIQFNDQIVDTSEFTIDDTNPDGPDMTAVRQYVEGLQANGGTAIYGALEQAYEVVQKKQAQNPDLLYSIVLMTDGENQNGPSDQDFDRAYAGLPDAPRAVHVYPINFGDSSKAALQHIADLTGGRLFDATTSSLADVFKQIRGYQ
jgi:Ca-activated chloride channel homolog